MDGQLAPDLQAGSLWLWFAVLAIPPWRSYLFRAARLGQTSGRFCMGRYYLETKPRSPSETMGFTVWLRAGKVRLSPSLSSNASSKSDLWTTLAGERREEVVHQVHQVDRGC